MNNTNFLKTIIVALLLMNGAMLAFLWFQPQRGRYDLAGILTSELKFTPEQRVNYDQLRNEHHIKMQELKHKNEALHDQFFKHINDETIDSTFLAAYIDSLAQANTAIEVYNFKHFRAVRSLCSKEQQGQFSLTIQRAFREMGKRPPR